MDSEVSGMMFSYISKSEYHGNCIPVAQRNVAKVSPHQEGHPNVIDLAACNQVSQDQIWKKAVTTEQKAAKTWENKWGFMAELDAKGNPIKKEELSEDDSRFSSGPVPNTNSAQYGLHLQTENTQHLLQMEFNLSAPNRKKKLSSDMGCY